MNDTKKKSSTLSTKNQSLMKAFNPSLVPYQQSQLHHQSNQLPSKSLTFPNAKPAHPK